MCSYESHTRERWAGSVPEISVFPTGISVSGLKILPYEHFSPRHLGSRHLEVTIAGKNGARLPGSWRARETPIASKHLLRSLLQPGYRDESELSSGGSDQPHFIVLHCHCIFHVISIPNNCIDTLIQL